MGVAAPARTAVNAYAAYAHYIIFFCDIIRVRAHNFLMPSTDDAYAVLEHAGVQKSYMNGIIKFED